ncbi:PilN domain-containing protein [Streptomyces caniscabiei]|uniref:PilN domain-containing protein n=1 Tax=Streptomyces caniscabiei TaxID=2746961 RepID=UPI0029BD242E|nr:PilN domain-containing protein [Streptomyces caniscabiei]MDX2776564.1 PilN domain-containing protein [Streptomyces caniscabiei]
MINLLPPDEKRQIRAARTNTLLIRYDFLLLGVVAFTAIAIGAVFFYLNNTKATAEATISENRLKASGYAAVEKNATEFRSNLATAKQILDREVTYTKVILDIAHAMPGGTVLESLNLDASTFGTPMTLVAKAKGYNEAIALKDALQKSSIFTDVHFESIVVNDADANYPITANLSVTIKKDAAK